MHHPIRSLVRLARSRRRGSVLILVVALVVLLALIGTAYLSSTQTERYTSAQNLINTEADLQMQGLISAVDSSVTGSLYGTTSTGTTYRPAGQQMPTYDGSGTYTYSTTTGMLTLATTTPTPGQAAFPAKTGYRNYDGFDTDLYLSPRVPDADANLVSAQFPDGTPYWRSVAWSPFPTAAGEYQIDSPLDASSSVSGAVASLPAAYKPYVLAYPTSKVGSDGQTYPGVVLYLAKVPPAYATNPPNTQGYPTATGCFTPSGFKSGMTVTAALASNSNINFAPNASGDGIADGAFFRLPGGPVAGITYYGAYRVLDGNSAVNLTTAYTSANDFAPTVALTTQTNYGFFRSNAGLQELMNSASATIEMASVNKLRFGGQNYVSGHAVTPIDDVSTMGRTDFAWYSIGDALENQLARRVGNPGYVLVDSTIKQQLVPAGPLTTAALAYRFSIQNPTLGVSPMEGAMNLDLTKQTAAPANNIPTSPYSAGDASDWFKNQFDFKATSGDGTNILTHNMPLRALVVGNNAVSPAVPPRVGNVTAPVPWKSGTTYAFGDWVTDFDASISKTPRSYVCIQEHLAASTNEPGTGDGVSPGATPFWAGTQAVAQSKVKPGVPWTRQPVKTSINTAQFDQLWLGFCQVMTDSIGLDANPAGGPTPLTAGNKEWQPPMQPTPVVVTTNQFNEQQMPMFRSVTRDNAPTTARMQYRLTSSQMLKLRAALAAVNTIDLRDSDDDVTSRRIILPDPTGGNRRFDVEVFGTERQPFIGSVYVHVDTVATSNNFIAIQLVNPYDTPLTLDPGTAGWKLGTVERTAYPDLKMTDVTTTVGWTTPIIIPAKSTTTGQPGIAVIESGIKPSGYVSPTTVTPYTITKLSDVLTAATTTGRELYLMKPRQQSGGASMTSARQTTAPNVGAFGESYAEASNIADLVPVDQLDLTNLVTLAGSGTADFYYRRGTDQYGAGATSPGLAGWNFVYPGPYLPPTTTKPYTGNLPQGFGSNMTTAPTASNPAMDKWYGYTSAAASPPPSPDLTGIGNPLVPTYQTYPVVLNNTYMAGVNRLAAAHGTLPTAAPTPPLFPFGEFARAADMYQIPFIGAYRVRLIDANGNPVTSTQVAADANGFLEMNSVGEDSSLAEDVVDASVTYATGTNPNAANATSTTQTDAPKWNASDKYSSQYAEQLGRFCPVGDCNQGATAATFDFSNTTGAFLHWHYHWANRLFDYFTVQSPADDYFPTIDPADADTAVTPNIPAKYVPLNPGTSPTPVANNNASVANAQTAGTSEDMVGIEGLININTAPWPVLASLPLVPAGTNNITYVAPASAATVGTVTLGADAANPDDRIKVAKAIVDDRTANGPFRSISDLYRVQAFRLENDSLLLAAPATATSAYTEPGLLQGVFSPAGFGPTPSTTPTGRPAFDFQDHFIIMNRISNLITTRSDTFTAYVLLQGYRNVGVAGVTPTLVVQRRAAYLLDRNGVTPANRLPSRFIVPTN